MKVLHLLQFFTIILVIFLTNTNFVNAQNLNSPIFMFSDYDKKEIGIFINAGQSFSNDKLYANCQDCIFKKPVGGNYDIGISFIHYLTEIMAYSINGGYKYSSLSSSFIEIETVKLEHYNEFIDVDFRNIGAIKTNNIFFTMNLRYIPIEKLFFETGLSVFFLSNATFIHEKELLTRTATLSNGEIVKLYINHKFGLSTNSNVDNKVVVQNSSSYPKLTIPIYLNLDGGYDFITRKDWVLSGKVQFLIPLSSTSNYIETLNINYWQVGIGFRYKLSEKTGGDYEN